MKDRVLVVQHDDLSPLGAIAEHLASEGISPTIIEPHRGDPMPSAAQFDILFVLGGQMEVWQEREHGWLVPEKAFIRHWVKDLDKPMLGICLGHQLLADALGGRVARARRGEGSLTTIALTEAGTQHPVYSGFGATKLAVSWHGSEVTDLPAKATTLSTTSDCAVSSFSVGSAAIGVQYHVEATGSQTDEWALSPAGAQHLVNLHGADDVPRVRQALAGARPDLWINSQRFYYNFMRLARENLAR